MFTTKKIHDFIIVYHFIYHSVYHFIYHSVYHFIYHLGRYHLPPTTDEWQVHFNQMERSVMPYKAI